MMGWHKHCMSKQVKANVEIFYIWKSFNIVEYHHILKVKQANVKT